MFRFTIRELVLLTLVVAMGVGWGLQTALHRALQKDYGYLRKRFDTAKALVQDNAQLTIEEADDGICVTMPNGWPQSLVDEWQPIPAPSPAPPPGLEFPVARRR